MRHKTIAAMILFSVLTAGVASAASKGTYSGFVTAVDADKWSITIKAPQSGQTATFSVGGDTKISVPGPDGQGQVKGKLSDIQIGWVASITAFQASSFYSGKTWWQATRIGACPPAPIPPH